MGDKTLKILNTALLAGTFLIGASVAASAADVYQRGSLKDPAPVEYIPAITWTGFYFGGHLGVAFNGDGGRFEYFDDVDVVDFDDNDNDDTSFLGGLHVGYNWQKDGGWVFGIEGDVSFADDIDYLASIRARLGYAWGSTLVYATGGAAFLGVEDFFGDDDTLNGWVAGVGIEHKFTQNVSFGLEGLYYNFGDGDTYDFDEGTYFEDEKDFWAVRARLTYHMGPRYEEPLK
jgi:outer membrane immunogenic protein